MESLAEAGPLARFSSACAWSRRCVVASWLTAGLEAFPATNRSVLSGSDPVATGDRGAHAKRKPLV